MKINLLTDETITLATERGSRRTDLPGLLQTLGEDAVTALPRVLRHQEDALHVFLCYLAGAVLARTAHSDPTAGEAFWREGIRRLTEEGGWGDDSAWCLLVDDPSKPAFMQPPLSAAAAARLKPKAGTPDELDLLPTAKNHDVKSSRAAKAQAEDWIYALVSLQTMSGFFGQGNYGIARMNGGFASRPIVGLEYGLGIGRRWLRDTRRLLEVRQDLLRGLWGYRPDGVVMTWLREWNLEDGLSLSELDPFFIEICRAVRLTGEAKTITAQGAPSKAPRIAAKELKGRIGDPWVPINQEKEAAASSRPPP